MDCTGCTTVNAGLRWNKRMHNRCQIMHVHVDVVVYLEHELNILAIAVYPI